jgi:hypothetical protein
VFGQQSRSIRNAHEAPELVDVDDVGSTLADDDVHAVQVDAKDVTTPECELA